MKRNTLILTWAALLIVAMGGQSCSKDEEETPTSTPEPAQFVATDASFQDWMSWPVADTNSGPDPFLGDAHAGNDTTVLRTIHIKDGQVRVNGSFPQGTIIVKHTTNAAGTVNEHTAMVKRGGTFDSGHNNWEYFMLMPDGHIATDGDGNAMRGSALMDGMCRGCHGGAAAQDYVFTQ